MIKKEQVSTSRQNKQRVSNSKITFAYGIKNDAGITLVALVVTIIVLIILATISINAVIGENGIIKKAQRAGELYQNSSIAEEEEMNRLFAEYENMMTDGSSTGENSSGGADTSTDPTPSYPTGPNGSQLVSSITTTDHDTINGEDDKGNQVVIPGGFKIADDSGTTVQQGIVIEDSDGNQFVWIPVSNIDGDGSNLIVLDDGSTIEITLGRYIFDATTGVETKKQYALNYEKVITVKTYYQELAEFRESNYTSETNATAKDLVGFIDSVSSNKGYYLARYEASYSSGTTFGVGDDSSYYKPASKVSTTIRASSSTDLTTGMLWGFIKQGEASMASRQMYYGNSYVESDLCNSYAWDTAIVYIQAMGNANYANQTDKNGTLKNTGTTGDEKCKIFDMAANAVEFTTEYCTYGLTDAPFACTYRGGFYNSNEKTSTRSYFGANGKAQGYSFRVLIYNKIGA